MVSSLCSCRGSKGQWSERRIKFGWFSSVQAYQSVKALCYTRQVMLFIHTPTSAALAPVFTHREDRGAWPWRQPA